MNVSLRRYADVLATYLRPQRPRVAALAALLLAGTGLQLAGPQIVRLFIDRAVGGSPLRPLIVIALLFIAAALVAQAVTVTSVYLSARVGWQATNMLRADLARHALRLDMPFHHTHPPGEMIERIDGDVTGLSTFFAQFVVQMLGSALLLIGVLALVWREEWRVGAVLTAFVLLALLVLARLRGYAVPAVAAQRQASADLFGFLEERFAGTDDIRANDGGAYVMRRFFQAERALLRGVNTSEVHSAVVWSSATALFALSYVVTLGMGAWLYQAGGVTIGTVYLFFQYTQLLRRPLEMITGQLKELQRAGAGVARVSELFQIREAVGSRQSAVDSAEVPDCRLPTADCLAVEFDRVSFAYDEGKTVLHDLSFHLPAGQVLGVLGRTGCGKTTLTRLLTRLYDPSGGAVRLGGIDVRALPLAELRQRIGIVTQDVQLFQASVRDNLTFFDERIPDERIIAVLRDLGLGAWYASLPRGLDSELTSGSGLSAGEAQLLAFARVFLKDPGLVILDEASSRLDPATERLIERAVDRLLAGRTGIVIAHRLSTVQRADTILILEDGRIREHGPRIALARDPRSRFATLLRAGLESLDTQDDNTEDADLAAEVPA